MNNNNIDIPTYLRKTARQIWQISPALSIDDVLEHDEIRRILESIGEKYDKTNILNWLLPDHVLREELPYLIHKPTWSLVEACAVWCDLNPFILTQVLTIYNKSFFGSKFEMSQIHLSKFDRLIILATHEALSGAMEVQHIGHQIYVTPVNFYNWAIKQTNFLLSGDSPKKLFAELNLGCESIAPVKPPTKLDQKRDELRRILALIKSIDPDLEVHQMPGRKKDFKNLCQTLNPKMFSISESTFADHLDQICTFMPGSRETNYYDKIAAQIK